jgi:glyoxylase-like metal-dependent hydrolase (beta-lactamase superfamily II)
MTNSPDRPYFAMPYPGIFRLTCATPMMGLPHVHVYMAQGSEGGLVVFDTAMPYDDSFDRILHGIDYLGRKPTDIERIYLTHAHPDHFGCAGMLQEASGAPVVCHPIAKRQFESMGDPDPERWAARFNIFSEHGWTPADMPESRMMSSAFSAMGLPKEMITIDEGDTVTFADGEWDIYWTPGHEEGHVVFHRASDGVMIVGDTVLGKITPHIGWMPRGPGVSPDEGPPDPLAQFLDSLDKVAKLAPSLLLPGHGRPLDEGAERARSIAAHHHQRLRRAMEIVIRKGPLNAIDIARQLFDRELMEFEERLALAETLSHVEYLRLRGRLHREMVDGVWLYEGPRSLVP